MTWKLTWREHTFTEDDLTGADLYAAQLVTGDGWRSCDPRQGPIHASNLAAVLVARTTDSAFKDVIAEMASASAAEVAGIFDAEQG